MYATIVEMIGKFESHWSHELGVSGRQARDWLEDIIFVWMKMNLNLTMNMNIEHEDQVFL